MGLCVAKETVLESVDGRSEEQEATVSSSSSEEEEEEEDEVEVETVRVTTTAASSGGGDGGERLSETRWRLGRTLTRGEFGVVKVGFKGPEAFAVKIVNKSQVAASDGGKGTQWERQILLHLGGHPFILRLNESFQTKASCCLVFELFETDLRSRAGAASAAEAVFYASCVIDAIEHMHVRMILYRNLRPENTAVDGDGYLRILDMGSATVLRNGRKRTLVGSPEYLSPELIAGDGYLFDADLWAFGIFLYEVLVGRPPFAGESSRDVYERINQGDVDFPLQPPVDFTLQAFVKALLCRQLEHRLGFFRGASEIKASAVLAPVDWDALRKKKIAPPHVPTPPPSRATSLEDDDAAPDDDPPPLPFDPGPSASDPFSHFGPWVDLPHF
mmetsp:Transcript_6648/g.20200  ORF Transcript_6648/g.20200 Transcript_6648/m.20200 type:complete len:387 (+) Transcript_6648:104-1264(+)